MLTDTKLRNLKPKDKLYKVNDRDGLYVAVTTAGSISFRYNYSINGRQETITFGRYGVGGITLAEARERLNEAKRMVTDGKSPAKEKARAKARTKDAETFGAWAQKWLRGYQMADSTRDMRRSVYARELEGKFGNQKLTEITHEDLRALTDAIVERGAPATAVHTRDIVLQVYRWAIERGQKVENPADLVRPASIARFEPRDRTLTLAEIGLMYRYMEKVGTTPSIRASVQLLLLTMVNSHRLDRHLLVRQNGESSGGGFKGSAVKAGRIAADTGANLMKGMGDMIGERLGHTAGGRLASSIRNSTKDDGDDGDKEDD